MNIIPKEISLMIFRNLSIREGKRLEVVSHTWRQYYSESITYIDIADRLGTALLLGILSQATESQIVSFNCPDCGIDSDVAQFLCNLNNLQSFGGRLESQTGLDILASNFKKLANLDLHVDRGTQITGDYLESLLASKVHLTRLCIYGAQISEIQRMRNLPMLEELKELILDGIIGFTKDGLLDIAEMKKLKKLRISNLNDIDESGFKVLLSSLTDLEELAIGDNNQLEVNSWSGLTNLQKLKKLDFLQTNLIMTELFNSFGRLTNLTSLNFTTFHVNPQDFQSLSKLSNNLNELAITLRGGKQSQRFLNVNSIGQLTNLTSLIVVNGVMPTDIKLNQLVNLRSLIFTEIPASKFQELVQLTKLTYLEVESSNQLSAWQWNKFTSLVNLQTLILNYGAITTMPLSQMPNLTYLATICEGRYVKEFSKLTQLKKMRLFCMNFSMANFEQLAALKLDKLERLSLSNMPRSLKGMFTNASCRITLI